MLLLLKLLHTKHKQSMPQTKLSKMCRMRINVSINVQRAFVSSQLVFIYIEVPNGNF